MREQANTVAVSPVRPARKPKDYFILLLKGFCMGASDVVPGVSGGTMAFILGIYEELINSIKFFFDLQLLRLILSFKIKSVLSLAPWPFLLAVFGGIILAVLSLAQGLEWTLENHPVLLWSFFFGLVLSSTIVVSKRVQVWSPARWLALMLAAGASFIIVGLVPVQTPEAPWFIFLSGSIVICAMILPGISGSLLLVVLGKYQYILNAVNERDILTIAIFVAGAAIGIVTFAQVVSWLFRRFHDLTVAALMGLMIGSLRKVWPWKLVGVRETNILPGAIDGEFAVALGLMLLGFVVVVMLDRLANRQEAAAPSTT